MSDPAAGGATAGERTLFRNADILVRWRGGHSRALCVVTFSSYTYDHRVDRPGFGEAFLDRQAIDAIHVITRDNRWYDYPAIAGILAEIASCAADYERAVTYGSSMGGFAALHFAGHVGAATAVAISPQFAVDSAHAPFETRWRRDARSVRFPAIASAPAGLQYIFVDPSHAIDARHASCFAAQAPARIVAVRHGGHPAGTMLAECDLLPQAILDCFDNRLDIAALERRVRERRRLSSQYLWSLAAALPDRRMTTRLALARMALACRRTDHSLRHLAALLVRTGDFASAEPLLREAVAMPDADIHSWIELVNLLEETGRLREARRLLATLRTRHPGNAVVRDRSFRHAFRRVGLHRLYDTGKRRWLAARMRRRARVADFITV